MLRFRSELRRCGQSCRHDQRSDHATPHAPLACRSPLWPFQQRPPAEKDEIETLAAWVDGGKLRGDDKDMPKPAAWPEGWCHGKPDLVMSMPEEFEVPADGVLPYQNWIIEPNFTEDKLGDASPRPARSAERGASRGRLHLEGRPTNPVGAMAHVDPASAGRRATWV